MTTRHQENLVARVREILENAAWILFAVICALAFLRVMRFIGLF